MQITLLIHIDGSRPLLHQVLLKLGLSTQGTNIWRRRKKIPAKSLKKLILIFGLSTQKVLINVKIVVEFFAKKIYCYGEAMYT